MSDTQKELRLIGYDEVCSLTQLGRTSLYHLEKEGKFPRRRRLGNRRLAWFYHEVQEWLAKLQLT